MNCLSQSDSTAPSVTLNSVVWSLRRLLEEEEVLCPGIAHVISGQISELTEQIGRQERFEQTLIDLTAIQALAMFGIAVLWSHLNNGPVHLSDRDATVSPDLAAKLLPKALFQTQCGRRSDYRRAVSRIAKNRQLMERLFSLLTEKRLTFKTE